MFSIFTDCGSNLSRALITEHDINVIPCNYLVDGEPVHYDGDLDAFDYKKFYDSLRHGSVVTTTLFNQDVFTEAFAPTLERGGDIIYIGLSSGISGTYHASTLAARELMEKYPGRRVRAVDSRGAGLGVGLLCCLADDYRRDGFSVDEAADKLESAVDRLCQYFTVDDLMFLRRTGRISTALAAMGTILGIKPMLWGNEKGQIVECGKFRGRKRVIDAIAEKYRTKVINPELQRVFISHGDCEDEARELGRRICGIARPRELYILPHEPLTGSHVGHGMLALFFIGDTR